MKEACGVVAVSSKKNISESLYIALMALQHRGQEASGIAVFSSDNNINTYKGIGLVDEAFRDIDFQNIIGNAGIGHNYYSVKISVPENAQPTLVHTSAGDIAIAHNGIITNSTELKEELMKQGQNFLFGSEEESIAYLLSDCVKIKSIEKAVKLMMKKIRGSYSFTFMVNDRIFGLRDPLGIKPLCIGKIDDGFIIASESVAIDALGGTFVRDVIPGELVEITPEKIISTQLSDYKNNAHCFFEVVYFARADSFIDGIDVFTARRNIGRTLAKEQPVKADVVVPLPDSGRTHAFGFAEASQIPLAEGLMKNRYIARTFILPTQSIREKLVQLKLNPIKSIVEGKKIVLVDDSIVRGTTMKKIVKMLRNAKAKEVHVRIGSPPIISPCYYGIDMTTRDQLIASSRTVEEIRKEINADTLGYISINGLLKALNISKNNVCLGCVTAEYPTTISGEKNRMQQRLETWKDE